MARAVVTGARAPQTLRGSWEVARVEADRATAPEQLHALDLDWIACDEPLPAAAALRAAGRWDGVEPLDLDSADWWYRCRFHAPREHGSSRLQFDGLATVAD